LHKKTDTTGRKKSGKKTPSDSSSKFEKLIGGAPGAGHYSFRLYISGSTPRSTRAVANIRSMCDEHLPGRYDLQVIDIYQQPEDAVDAQIIAAPTLVKLLPKPLRRFIGNLSNPEKLLVALSIRGGIAGAAA
jgi:circadian clock protein KaiB